MSNNAHHDDENARKREEILDRLAAAASEDEPQWSESDISYASNAMKRVLDNLGLSGSAVEAELHDSAIADRIDEWANVSSSDDAMAGHRGQATGVRSFGIEPSDAPVSLVGVGEGSSLTATVEITHPGVDISRIHTTLGLPGHPAVQSVIAAVSVRGRTEPIRFPLTLTNRGNADFPLYEFAGAASLPERDLPDDSVLIALRLEDDPNATPSDLA